MYSRMFDALKQGITGLSRLSSNLIEQKANSSKLSLRTSESKLVSWALSLIERMKAKHFQWSGRVEPLMVDSKKLGLEKAGFRRVGYMKVG